MAISDVEQALLNVGTISKTDVATISYVPATDTTAGTAVSQASWFGARGLNSLNYLGFASDGDTTGATFNFEEVFKTGVTTTTVGTIVAYDSDNVVFFDSGNYYMVASNGLSASDGALFPITDFATTGSYTPPPPVCFVEGTRIRTERGDVHVEDLVEGDQVHVLDNAETPARKVIWIGHREINLASHPDPYEAQPIRIRRDAFAKGVPNRDLLVSPDHAVYVTSTLIPDGVLIPARLLVNGASIVRETRLTRVRYFHVELDRHSVIFSEDLPSESYLDTGNRSFFQNGGAVIDLNVGFVGHRPVIGRDTHCCRPFVYAARTVEPIWSRLAKRAEQIGYRLPELATTTDPALHVTMDGRAFQPIRSSNELFSFILPPNATEVRLVSNAARPCDTRPWIEDHRVLGVSVSRIRLRDLHEVADLPLDGPGFGRGWWAIEHDTTHISRWTNGDAVLRLPEASGSSRVLELQIGGDILYPLGIADVADDLDAHVRVA